MKLSAILPGAVLGALFLLPLSCGSKPAANASFDFGDAGAAPPGQPCAPGQPCPPPPVATTPVATNTAPPPNDPNANPLGNLANPATEMGLQAAAAQYAAGMNPEGNVVNANLAEGGHTYFVTNMDASKCYTIVGFGLGVTDLDLVMLAPPLYTIPAGQDGTAGPTAVIQKTCPLIPLPVAYKIDVFAKKGAGSVAVRVYSKPK